MRLLHVVATGQRRGAEMFASDLVRALGGIGAFDQEVAILRGPWPPDVAYDAPVRSMRSNGRPIPGLRMDLTTMSSLRRTLARFRPHVVHAHGGEAFKYLAIGGGRRPRLVYRRIGLAHPSGTRGIARAGHAALLRRSDFVVAVAEAVRRETIDTFGLPADRVVTIPRGVDPLRLRAEHDRSAVRENLGIPGSAPVVISVGALSPEKDPIAALDLCATLAGSMPDVTYLFAGDGPMRETMHEAVRARGLQGHVRLLGSRADIGDLLGASDLLVLASRSEGMPGCVIEAGMASLPVVAFRVAGVPEVLTDGVTGYVVDPGDHEALARRTLELLGDEALRRAMGKAAEERCRAVFAIDRVAERYADVYAEVTRP
jgi:glycosyltransferase involved in cell wall biosynthesis